MGRKQNAQGGTGKSLLDASCITKNLAIFLACRREQVNRARVCLGLKTRFLQSMPAAVCCGKQLKLQVF